MIRSSERTAHHKQAYLELHAAVVVVGILVADTHDTDTGGVHCPDHILKRVVVWLVGIDPDREASSSQSADTCKSNASNSMCSHRMHARTCS